MGHLDKLMNVGASNLLFLVLKHKEMAADNFLFYEELFYLIYHDKTLVTRSQFDHPNDGRSQLEHQ
jgi:hypothetical protein